jgi:acyl-CoA thioesterase FadM
MASGSRLSKHICRYVHPAHYDEEIAVKTWIARANRRMIEFQYDIREAQTAQRLAEGGTKHIFLGPDMKPLKLPEKYHACFGVSGNLTAG